MSRHPRRDRHRRLAELFKRGIGARHAHEDAARKSFLVVAEQLDGIGVVDQRAPIVADSVERQRAHIVSGAVRRRTANELVRHLHGPLVIRQLEKYIDGLVQRGDGRAAVAHEIEQAVRGFPPVTELVERKRKVVDAFLVARLTLQLLQAKPDERISRGP